MINRDERSDHEERLRQYKVEAKEAERNKQAAPEPPTEPVPERTMVGDTTVEKLAEILDGNPRGVLINRDELSGWVRGLDQYKGGKGSDRQVYLSIWSNEVAQFDRKNQSEPVFLERPFAGLYGSIQPAVLGDLRDGREDGMLERFLFCYPDPVISDWSDDEVSAFSEAAYAELYDGLRDLRMVREDNGDLQPELAYLTPEAKEQFIGAYNDQAERRAPGFPRALDYLWPKLVSYLARLSLILAMCRAVTQDKPTDRVECQDVLAATVLVSYFKSRAPRVYATLYREDPQEDLAYDLARLLAEQYDGCFEGPPADLFEALESKHKPANASWLTKKIKDLEGFDLEESHISVKVVGTETGRTTERFLKITLQNGVNAMRSWCAVGERV